jgi:hypothetical protein
MIQQKPPGANLSHADKNIHTGTELTGLRDSFSFTLMTAGDISTAADSGLCPKSSSPPATETII